jgi:protein O-mannosyl-transferase
MPQPRITTVILGPFSPLLLAKRKSIIVLQNQIRLWFTLSSTAFGNETEAPAVSREVRLRDHRWRRHTILCLLLVLVTVAVYNRVAHNGFTNFDDTVYLTDNTHIRGGLTWDTVRWAFTTHEAANWHPITWLAHALDYQLFKLNPAGHHYVSVLFHAANAVLLFLLLEIATGCTWPSLMVAALFALHPVNVESVAWAAERKNVLSMFFFLLTLHAYHRYVRKVSIARYLPVAVLFALGLMAKPEVITLPFVLLLWDYWPLQRMRAPCTMKGGADFEPPPELEQQPFLTLVLEKVPLFALCAGSAVITLIAQRGGHAIRGASARVRFGNAVVAYVRYLGKAFWPERLAVLYPHLGRLLPTWEILASTFGLIAVTVLVLRWRDHRYLPVGWFWFLGTLVPVIGLVQVGVQAMADRYAYLSFIGLFICFAWGVADLAQRGRISSPWLAAPAFLVLATLGTLTYRQIGYWHDSETLWRHALSVTDKNYTAHDGLAGVLAQKNRPDDAIAEYKAAGALHAYPSSEMVSIALYELAHGRVQEAIAQLQQAVGAAPDQPSRANALAVLGSAFMQSDDVAHARMAYSDALQQNADNPIALVGAGLLAERDGDDALAVAEISRAMHKEPTDVGYLLLAQALRHAGRLSAAAHAEMQAEGISHNISEARRSATNILDASGISKH